MTSNSVNQLEIFKCQQEGADKKTMMTQAPHAAMPMVSRA